jgi:branched-chain amino acid transport system substrate-binding protein
VKVPEATRYAEHVGPAAQGDSDILKLHDSCGHGSGEVGQVLYTRGVTVRMLSIEAVRRAQGVLLARAVMTGEQVRWGLENLALDQKKLDSGLCRHHAAAVHVLTTWARTAARVHLTGSKWEFQPDFIQADEQIR